MTLSVDTLNAPLEEFYDDPNWNYQLWHDGRIEQGSVIPDCGVYRVPGGRVRCTMLTNHEGLHRGYDARGRRHSWS